MNEPRSVWSQRSACIDKPEIFLADRPNRDDYAPICNKVCPVKDLCLAHAIVNDEQGIWGGMTYLQRKKLPATFKLSLRLSEVPRESPISEYLKEDHQVLSADQEQQSKVSNVIPLRRKSVQALQEDAKVVLSGLDSFLLALQDISSQTKLLAG
jgi:hypothetical protein